MAKASETERSGPGTQPADAQTATSATVRPLSTQAVFRPDFGDEDNFPIRRSARTPSRKTGWPPPAGCARRSDGWAAAWWKSRGRPISIRLRP